MTFKLNFFKNNQISILIIFTIILSLLFWSPLIKATWGPADDFEIINWLGSDRNIFFSEFIKFFYEGEGWSGFGEIRTRFRPNYSFFRILETYFFSDNLSLWYLSRISFFIIFFISLVILLKKYFGFFTATLFCLIELLFPYWIDIVGRLGAAESYILVGLSIILLSLTIKNPFKSNLSILLACLGTILCVGTKENFVILIFIPLLIIYLNRFSLNISKLLFTGSALIFCLFISFMIFKLLQSNNYADDYGSNIYEKILILRNIGTSYFILWSLLIFIYTYYKFIKNNLYKKFLKNELHIDSISSNECFVILVFFAYLLYIFNFFFYSGNFPNGTRYDFPSLILSHVTFLIFLYELNYSKNLSINRIFQKNAILFLVFLTICNIILHRFESLKNVFRQNNFMYAIKSTNDYLNKNPDSKLIIKSYCGGTEHAFTAQFLLTKYYSNLNKVMLLVDNKPNKSCGGGGNDYFQFNQSMLDLQKNGGNGFYKFETKNLEECFSLGLDGPHYEKCKGVIFYRKHNSNYEKYKFSIKEIFNFF